MKLLLTVISTIAACAAADFDMDSHGADTEVRLRLQHSLDMGKTWEHRGIVALTRSKSGNGAVNQDALGSDAYDSMKKLCDNNQFYLIKLISESGTDELQSYGSACSLLESGLAETLTVLLDWRGNIVAVNLAVRSQEAPFKGRKRDQFDTKVVIQNMENGPAPDTAAFIQKMDEEKARKISGDVKDNRSFFAKYWMYIVPVCLFMAINSAAGPEAGGGR